MKKTALHGRAGRVDVEAGGDLHPGRRGHSADGCFGAGLLPLEEGVGVGGLRRVKQLEVENCKLKQLIVDMHRRDGVAEMLGLARP